MNVTTFVSFRSLQRAPSHTSTLVCHNAPVLHTDRERKLGTTSHERQENLLAVHVKSLCSSLIRIAFLAALMCLVPKSSSTSPTRPLARLARPLVFVAPWLSYTTQFFVSYGVKILCRIPCFPGSLCENFLLARLGCMKIGSLETHHVPVVMLGAGGWGRP